MSYPTNPTTGDTYILSGKTWKYDGANWVKLGLSRTLSAPVAFSDLTSTPTTLSGYGITGDIDAGGNKVLFANMYATESDLPSATTYHGMFAHVHATGAGYFAHAGNWIKLANHADLSSASASDSRQDFVADGTVGARAGVFLTPDGKVSASPAYLLSDYDQISDLGTLQNAGTAGVPYSGASGCSAFSTQDNKIVSIMKNVLGTTSINMQYLVSTLAADGTLSHGTLTNFNTSSFPFINAINMKYNAAINRFICWGGNGYGSGSTGASAAKQFVAIGTLDASNNTVAWTFTNVTAYAYASAASSNIAYNTYENTFDYCPFAVATDGSHMAVVATGYYTSAAESQASMRAFSIDASNNTVSAGSWVAVTQDGTAVKGNYGDSKSITWHNGTSQYIVQFYGGNVYSINSSTYASYLNATAYWLATVSGNTISQVTSSSVFKTDAAVPPLGGGASGGNNPYNKTVTWTPTDNANVLWGISGVLSYNAGIVLHRITIGSGTLGSYSRSTGSILLRDKALSSTNEVSDGGNKTNQVRPIAVGSGTANPKWLLNFLNADVTITGLLSTAKWTAEITYNSSSLGEVTISESTTPSTTQAFDPTGALQYYPSGGNCWTYDSNRNQAVAIGTTCLSDGTAVQKYVTAVAVKTGARGSLNKPIGLNDSSSSVSDGNTVTTAMLGSVVSGFSGLSIGSNIIVNGISAGKAISATKVFVTADGEGG